jgi:uncharacterized membrane protein YbhN (UPF0104 family)
VRRLLHAISTSLWARALVSAGLLAVVVSRIDLSGAGRRLAQGSWGMFAAAVAALLASFLVGALRWRLYLAAAGVETSAQEAVRAYLIGAFSNNFLPSQVGGDVARAWVAGRPGRRLRAATTVAVDRATALACLIGLGWIGYAGDPGAVPGELVAALAAATGAVAVAAGAGLLLLRSARLALLAPRRLRTPGREARAALAACLERAVLARTLAIGLGFQGLVLLAAWLIARSIELDVPLPALAASLAPVLIVSVLPVSIGGFGVREGSYVVLLGYAGVGATDATLFSLLSGAAFALASLPGGLALLRPPEAPVSSVGEGR